MELPEHLHFDCTAPLSQITLDECLQDVSFAFFDNSDERGTGLQVAAIATKAEGRGHLWKHCVALASLPLGMVNGEDPCFMFMLGTLPE